MNPKLRAAVEWTLFLAAVTVIWLLVPYPAQAHEARCGGCADRDVRAVERAE